MERLPYPIPLNPNAKYLPNSISNVLYSIQKFDQSTLAWPTCQRKTDVSFSTGKAFTSPSEVPLAGTESFVVQNKRQYASLGNAREAKKNTFYQILQASQDQPCFPQSCRIKRKNNDTKFKSDFKDDIIYNDIYDIVRSHTQYKRLPKLEKQPEQQKPFSASPPVVEVYKVRPVATETKEAKGKTCQSSAKANKLQETTNELSNSKRTTHPSKPKLTESKGSKKKIKKIQEKLIEPADSKRTKHPSKSRLTDLKSSKKKSNILREQTNEFLDLKKKNTHRSKPKLTASKSSRKQFATITTRENKKKANSKSENNKTIQQLWPLPDRASRSRWSKGPKRFHFGAGKLGGKA
ncbi:uncharacterized protein LOC122616932 isoform X2 [Drosophila teissieri]|uniref:uncharacterized protein LOC122616932 isoform X2 n=1 Tax=Drosophila teissieri TaxID=7243 RepID=UPI001CB9E697|nr:uncharacterized protein LOC122616932 isoform X2 [Drosophila teissieri]